MGDHGMFQARSTSNYLARAGLQIRIARGVGGVVLMALPVLGGLILAC